MDNSNRKEIDVCRECLLPKSDHCTFEAIEIPKSCICDIHEWLDPSEIPDVCDEFIEHDGHDGICYRCEHLRGCHVDNKK